MKSASSVRPAVRSSLLGVVTLATLGTLGLGLSLAAAPGKEVALTRKPAPAPPLKAGVTAVSTHGPFATGECALCHEKKDPKK